MARPKHIDIGVLIAPPGRKLVACDYSQIELRSMAHLSEDAGLLRAFAAGTDIHRATAAEVFGKTLEDVTGDERRAAKAVMARPKHIDRVLIALAELVAETVTTPTTRAIRSHIKELKTWPVKLCTPKPYGKKYRRHNK